MRRVVSYTLIENDMQSNFHAIREYDQAIRKIYKEYNLKCLRDYKIGGKNTLTEYTNVTEYYRKKNREFDFLYNSDDLLLIFDEILYFTANTILYEQFINDPRDDKFPIPGGRYIYPNYQNLHAKRFDMYVDVSFEKLYNFWDRIGDLIDACIPTGLPKREIYFAKVLKNIPDNFRNIEGFTWLDNFYKNDFKELSGKRREIVHYTSTGTNFRFEHALTPQNEKQINALMEKRRNVPKLLCDSLVKTIEGFEETLIFLKNAQRCS